MNILTVSIIIIIILAIVLLCLKHDECFDLDAYLRPNYQSGAGMLRGDLPIQKTQQSWFNTRYGASSLTPGFF